MLLTFFIRILEFIFAAGIVGCLLVLMLTMVEDIRTLFGGDENPEGSSGYSPAGN